MNHLITALLVLPIVGALVVATLPKAETKLAHGVGIAFAVLEFLVSLPLISGFAVGQAGMQFETNVPWIAEFGINYHVGVDGFSLWIILLTTLLTPLCIWGAWNSIDKRGAEFVASMLVLETGMIGALVALDLILFFVFWELMLIPMYLIIGVWGSEQRVAAAIKFFIYTMVGSALMLAAMIYLAVAHWQASGGVWTFDLQALQQVVLTPQAQALCFWAFVASFAIKVPLFPVHTWLPDAHTQAPTPGSVILAGVLLKLGTYGMLRFAFPLFPLAAGEGAQILAILAIIGIIYGALVAYVQTDAKRLVAYSSVSHMGFIVLGIASVSTQGFTGATFQSLAHGLTTGALFMAIGVLYERRHTRLISEFGGLAKVMPWFTAFFMIAMLGSAGLPSLVGFVGEFLIVVGAFAEGGLTLINAPVLVTVAAVGVILGAVYLLLLFQRLMFGPLTNPKNEGLADLGLRERLVFLPVIALIILMGVYPQPFLSRIDPTSQAAVASFNLKRCASIRHALGERPVMMETLVDRCADPVAVIAATYGDQRLSANASAPTTPPPAAAAPPPPPPAAEGAAAPQGGQP
ncbi:complex I subunit 4 family protein [Paraliomyxa miuraensis]|uniref:complex I subunit 4 family protein n=1 Tax=Paraliomyxa miuraensis TaxID=376150 RepID=UPI00225A4515|nr:NADH-quinone oxidoreductase subunit M [Paraliomyxa miuraensis]MCX4243161.1 NADH-quinone oxidoreductase subunit M [Paraliomyxa miuraensis]